MAKREHTVQCCGAAAPSGRTRRACMKASPKSVFTLSLHRCLNTMHLLYPSLCIVVAIALTKEKRGPSSFMVASAAVVCIPSGMPVSYHSGASRFLQEAARYRGSDGSARGGRHPRRGLWTRDLELTSRRSLTVVQARWSAFANRAARSVATWPGARQFTDCELPTLGPRFAVDNGNNSLCARSKSCPSKIHR